MLSLTGAEHNPPPVSDTQAAFLKAYPRPLPGLYDTIIQELLVVQHLIRFQKRYQYSSVRIPANFTPFGACRNLVLMLG